VRQEFALPVLDDRPAEAEPSSGATEPKGRELHFRAFRSRVGQPVEDSSALRSEREKKKQAGIPRMGSGGETMATTTEFDSCFDCRDKTTPVTLCQDCRRLRGAQLLGSSPVGDVSVDIVDCLAAGLASEVIDGFLVLGDDDMENAWFGLHLPPPLPSQKPSERRGKRNRSSVGNGQTPLVVQLLDGLSAASRFSLAQGEVDA